MLGIIKHDITVWRIKPDGTKDRRHLKAGDWGHIDRRRSGSRCWEILVLSDESLDMLDRVIVSGSDMDIRVEPAPDLWIDMERWRRR